jgi:hypothetical protein
MTAIDESTFAVAPAADQAAPSRLKLLGQVLCVVVQPPSAAHASHSSNVTANLSTRSLTAGAQEWANHLALTGQYQHSGAPGVGENLNVGTGGEYPRQRRHHFERS